jgi:hypothetical protein
MLTNCRGSDLSSLTVKKHVPQWERVKEQAKSAPQPAQPSSSVQRTSLKDRATSEALESFQDISLNEMEVKKVVPQWEAIKEKSTVVVR